MQSLYDWIRDYGIAQDFDVEDAVHMIRTYELEKEKIDIYKEGVV